MLDKLDSLNRRGVIHAALRAADTAKALCFAVVLVFGAAPAGAQVLEISADGDISVRAGGGAAIWTRIDEPHGGAAEPQLHESVVVPDQALTEANVTVAAAPEHYAALVRRAAESANISPALLAALVWQESRWNQRAISPKGAIGLAQLMPGTARDLGVNPYDPADNLMGGARYLRQMLDEFDGNIERALAGYNAGPGRVRRSNGIPRIRETQLYVSSIVKRLNAAIVGGM